MLTTVNRFVVGFPTAQCVNIMSLCQHTTCAPYYSFHATCLLFLRAIDTPIWLYSLTSRGEVYSYF